MNKSKIQVVSEELLRERRRFSAPVLGGKFLVTNHLIAQAISALKGGDCALSCLFK